MPFRNLKCGQVAPGRLKESRDILRRDTPGKVAFSDMDKGALLSGILQGEPDSTVGEQG